MTSRASPRSASRIRAAGDGDHDQAVAERLWGDRIERSYAYGTLHRAGARLAGGSDAPVEALDPLEGIRAAVLREWRPTSG
jgi:predicted amidohydrolase YtcJ